MRSGKLQRAVAEFQKVLHLDSGLLEARVNLGVAYQMLGQYDLAVVELSKAMGEKPNLGPNIILGMDYLKLGSPAKALGPLQEALTIEPSNREAHRAVAACYWVQDKYKEASKEFLSVFSLEPDTERAWSDLGRDYLAMARRLAGRMADKYQSSPWALDFLSVGFSVRDEPTVNQRMIDRGLCERLVQQWEGEVLS
jgi:tetratricopeptide (TPR) repeat protein